MPRPASQAGPDIKRIMGNMAGAVTKGSRNTVTGSAMAAKKVHTAAIAKVAGADMRLSGVGKAKGRVGGGKINVNFKVSGNGGNVSGIIRPTGPIQLIENDTKGRVIRSAYSKGKARKGFVGPTIGGQFSGGGRGGKAVLNIPGVGFRRSVRHPGTKGQHPWEKGRKLAEPVIRRAMSKQTTHIIKGAMGL
jgi:hypothetical protein